jgi:HK97 family phage major capsid protein
MLRELRAHGRVVVDLPPSERYTTRALQSAGGSAVPTLFYDKVAWYARTATPMLDGSIVTVVNRDTGNPIVFPRLTADPSTGGTVTAEGGAITEADATISSVTVTPKAYKLISLWSRELDTDEAIGLEDLLARSVARQLALSAGAKLTTDTGTDAAGIVYRAELGGTATGTAGNTTLDTFFGPADLIDLKYSRPLDVRARGAFMVSTTAMSKIRKMRDSNRQFLLNPAVSGGVPTFDGSPVYENPSMAAVASATKSVLFGDMAAYHTVRLPVRVELSIDYKFGVDQVALRVVDRVSGDLPDVTAIAYQVAANT